MQPKYWCAVVEVYRQAKLDVIMCLMNIPIGFTFSLSKSLYKVFLQ